MLWHISVICSSIVNVCTRSSSFTTESVYHYTGVIPIRSMNLLKGAKFHLCLDVCRNVGLGYRI